MLKKSLFALVILEATTCFAVPEARAPLMPVPPVIDGNIGADEWRGSTGFYGLGVPLDAREGRVWVGCDRDRLYLAFQTEMPPDGKLVSNKKMQGDSKVVLDDSIELWVVPPEEGRTADAKHGKGYFQLIINSIGTVFALNHEPGYGLSAAEWKPDLSWAISTEEGFWSVELSIPMQDFAMDKLVFPSTWRLRLARNWKNGWNQAAVSPGRPFSDKQSMTTLILDENAPAVRMDSRGHLMDGRTDVQLKLFNPGADEVKLDVSMTTVSGEETVAEETKTIILSADHEETTNLPVNFQPADENVLSVAVNYADGAGPVYRRDIRFGRPPEKKWSLPEAYLTFNLSFDNKDLTADMAAGEAVPLAADIEHTFIEGVKGQAVLFKEHGGVKYDNAVNLQIPGAVSFWVKLLRDRKPGARTCFWRTEHKSTGTLGIQDSIYNKLMFFYQYFPGIEFGHADGGKFPWRQGRWYHIGANIEPNGVELFLDGRKVGSASFERALESNELSPFQIGEKAAEVAIDELQIFSRTLHNSEMAKLALGESAMDGKISWFPSLHSLVIDGVIEPEVVGDKTMALVVTDTSEETVFLNQVIPDDEWQAAGDILRLRTTVPLPDLEDREYKTFIHAREGKDTSGGRQLLSRMFVVKHYPWAGNKLGKSDVIVPPFTPLEVRGDRVSCILRDYQLGALGLPEQITSLDKDILSRPVSVQAVVDGKATEWSESEPVVFTQQGKHVASFTSGVSNETVEINSTGIFDYDGLLSVTLTVKPKRKRMIDRLFLDIPLKEEVARLFHAVGEGIRANPAGLLPDSEGLIFESKNVPHPYLKTFIPYLWIGGEKRGVCWVADGDRDWIHSDSRSALEVIRENGEVIVRVNIINGPVALRRERTVDFALMASPVKPMPEGWRDRIFNFPTPGRTKNFILWTAAAGFHYGWASRYPLDKDWTYIEKLMDARETGTIDHGFIDAWITKVINHPGQLSHRRSEEYLRRHVEGAFRSAQRFHDTEGRLMPYSVACDRTELLPEHDVYGDEWEYRKRMHCSESFRDYAIWYAAEFMDRGMDGIYVDNTFTHPKFAWPTGEGYIDEDGEIQPSLGILSRTRPLIRRLATMMVEKGKDPFVFVHMTNGNVLPMLSFAQANLGWEWKYGRADFQDKFSPGYMRAVNTGQQAGTIPVALGGVTGFDKNTEKAEYIRVSRTALAMALPHHFFLYARIDRDTAVTAREIIAEFVQDPDSETHFYWEKNRLLETPANLMVTVHRTGNQLLLVIGNLEDKGTYEIALEMDAFGVSGIAEAVDRETGANVTHTADTLSIEIDNHDFALIGVELE
ncbi:MAG: DUF6067 family protein [Candidatus Pacebacteria bacterium]|nr:DUF6067 family protein [Candidatus Paceibacterota bacterium]